MKTFVGLTDYDWFQLLAAQPHLDEVNFWQPGGSRIFRALAPGELFLFKLHAPRRSIVGGGFFAHSTLLPVSLAWEAFGIANGAISLEQMRSRIERYRRRPAVPHEDYQIGCVLLEQPFFLPELLWVPEPADWKRQIVQGRTCDLQEPAGRALWETVRAALASLQGESRLSPEPMDIARDEIEGARHGAPVLVTPRLGQGSFRILVTDAYERRCAVTGERVLPVLEAAHIRPYALGGEHRVDNGLLLRSDLHTLFDRGYLTVTPDLHLEVSGRIREDWDNGRHYYSLHGSPVRAPLRRDQHPGPDLLRWHNEEVFRA
jgi:putative restriction endonuclease